MRMTAALLPLLVLAACGDNAAGPGGLTEGEARELDEAAAIVDAQRIDEDDLPADLRRDTGE